MAITWAALGLLAASQAALITAIFNLGGRIDALGARLDGRIDGLSGRIDGLSERMARGEAGI